MQWLERHEDVSAASHWHFAGSGQFAGRPTSLTRPFPEDRQIVLPQKIKNKAGRPEVGCRLGPTKGSVAMST